MAGILSAVIGGPADDFDAYVSDPAFGLAPGDQGFGDDPDRDGLASGLEAFSGTHPGEFNPGLGGLDADGPTTTFSHSQKETRPGDGEDGPVGGPSVTFSAQNSRAMTTVTPTATGSVLQLFSGQEWPNFRKSPACPCARSRPPTGPVAESSEISEKIV